MVFYIFLFLLFGKIFFNHLFSFISFGKMYIFFLLIFISIIWQNLIFLKFIFIFIICAKYIFFIIYFHFYPLAKTGWFLVPSAATCGRQLPTNHPVAALALAVRVAKCICSNCQIYLWTFSNILVKIAKYICILVQISNCICPNQTTNHPVAAENFFLATFPGYSKLLTGCQWQRKKW